MCHFPALSLLTAYWQFEIVHGDITYTREIGKHCGVCPREPTVGRLPSHGWVPLLLPGASWFEMAGMANKYFIKDWERTVNKKLNELNKLRVKA